MAKNRVAITGMGALSPIGKTVAEAYENALAGNSGVGKITRFDSSAFPTQIAAEVKDFDAEQYIPKKELKKLDLYSQYAIAASLEAWEDAGLDKSCPYDAERLGCILGVGIGGLTTLEKYHEAYLEGGPRKISPFLIPSMISNLGPGNVAIRLGLKGINYTTTSACTSSTHSIGEAMRLIQDGLQDVVVSGGSESAVTPIGIGGFNALRALSTRNEEPQKASRPFDKDRDGFVLGEGAAILILENYESAEKRGANILGEVIGYGFSCDAYHITAPSEDGSGAVACMKMAVANAGIDASEIGYVNAHGTSTDANDKTESQAIRKVFGAHADTALRVSSTKSVTGHLLGAAGAIEAVLTVKGLQNSKFPPSINLDEPGEGCDLNYIKPGEGEFSTPYALSNSFGFGGTNASVVLAKPR